MDIKTELIKQYYDTIELVLKACVSVGQTPEIYYYTDYPFKCKIRCGCTEEIIEFPMNWK